MNQPDGEAKLAGILADQAVFYGILDQMRNVGIEVISVSCVKIEEEEPLECREENSD
ncbi:MAG: hypothetical protein GY759_03580 [Chloroflexi bacterium]|nr:hypothetical protein [Chloroflexota bacterium]